MKSTVCRLRQHIFRVMVLSFILANLLPAARVFAALPNMRAAVTSQNVLKILRKYDADGYYLLTQTAKTGKDYMLWFTSGTITKDIDTAVHESSHTCTGGDFFVMKIYRGKKKFYRVTVTDNFYSREMAASVPAACRTFRFSSYIENASGSQSSNAMGAYGLLNELCAYGWGMNNTVKLYPYYAKYASDPGDWVNFINSGANDRQAYAEFNFFILHYLYYAKKHHPSVYKGIMNNKSFRSAYKFTEKQFRKNIAEYEADLKKIVKKLKKKGISVRISDNYIWIGDDYAAGLYEEDYKAIKKVTKKKCYQSIYKQLIR